jgi:hypothetical protein
LLFIHDWLERAFLFASC